MGSGHEVWATCETCAVVRVDQIGLLGTTSLGMFLGREMVRLVHVYPGSKKRGNTRSGLENENEAAGSKREGEKDKRAT